MRCWAACRKFDEKPCSGWGSRAAVGQPAAQLQPPAGEHSVGAQRVASRTPPHRSDEVVARIARALSRWLLRDGSRGPSVPSLVAAGTAPRRQATATWRKTLAGGRSSSGPGDLGDPGSEREGEDVDVPELAGSAASCGWAASPPLLRPEGLATRSGGALRWNAAATQFAGKNGNARPSPLPRRWQPVAVWGTGVDMLDSRVRSAVVHAGAISQANGGRLRSRSARAGRLTSEVPVTASRAACGGVWRKLLFVVVSKATGHLHGGRTWEVTAAQVRREGSGPIRTAARRRQARPRPRSRSMPEAPSAARLLCTQGKISVTQAGMSSS